MKISTKGRYALRLMLDLAEHRDEGFVSLNDVAKRQGISKLYLEQIVALLNASKFLRSGRGKQGGYKLAKEPSRYTAGQILRVTEGSLAPVPCLDDEVNQCERAAYCKTLPLWAGLSKVVSDYLDGITLLDLLEQSPGQSGGNYMI
jgi:Rrf2 family protein